jgi:hypothetical protein
MSRTRLLLHVCCAPCATAPVERVKNNHEVTLFFSNSNVWPSAEYYKRLDESRKLARLVDLPLVIDAYEHASWRNAVRGLEEEPEGGERCRSCFGFSLARAARYAEQNAFPAFSTTLTVSPHKSSRIIFDVGATLLLFSPLDFKKQDGFKRSTELSKEYGLYRQHYCGCEFSRRNVETA